MRVSQYRIEGLGHLSTLVADEVAGVAALVDPRRDVDLYLAEAADAGLRITHVVETHLHNDYVSGGRELAALTGADHLIGAGAELRYEHRPMRHGQSADLGALRMTVLDTPGHTPEHVAWELADTSRADEPVAILTGGSLLVGAVGRTDLLGADNAVPFAHRMYHSLHDVLLPHEDFVGIYPTHGAGSLCSTGIASTPSSTIGFERRYDPLLAPMDVDAFARALLAGQPAFPRYFARMRPINQGGPPLTGGVVPAVPGLTPGEADVLVARGALVLDARPPEAHAAGHLLGSLSIPRGSSFGTWLGWVVDADQPVVLVVDDAADLDDLARQAFRIGYDGLIGYVTGGFEAWRDAGRTTASGGDLDPAGLARALETTDPAERPLVIDVRQATEYEAGHVPGSWHIGAGDLPDRLDDLPRDRPVACICGTGYRSSVAASLLRSRGIRAIRVTDGVPTWEALGLPVERGLDTAAGATR